MRALKSGALGALILALAMPALAREQAGAPAPSPKPAADAKAADAKAADAKAVDAKAAKPSDAPAADASKPAQAAPAEAGGNPASKPEEPKPEETVAPATPEMFDEALARHYAGDARDAAAAFYAFIRGSTRTADNYEWAEYFLAEDLATLGFTQASIAWLADVTKNRTHAEILPVALGSMEKLAARVPYDAELVERELLAGTDFGPLPARVDDFVQFHKGLAAFRDGQLRWAWKHFDKIAAGTLWSARARMVRAVHVLKTNGDADAALAEFEALGADPAAPREVRNDARIAAARLHYEKGAWDKAHAAYDSVELPELDPGRGPIYLEKAWTFYRMGDASRAAGLLLALEAPSFRDLFLPEKYVLAALIYKDRCQYLPAKRAARGLLRRYRTSLEHIRERQPLRDDARLFAAALQIDPAARKAGERLDQIARERDRLDAFSGRFEESGLTRALRKLYDRTWAEASRQREAVLERALMDAADQLLRQEEQVRLLDYEIGLDLYKRVRKGAVAAAPAAEPETDAASVLFAFDGEYWNDELKDFRLWLPSRCGATEGDR